MLQGDRIQARAKVEALVCEEHLVADVVEQLVYQPPVFHDDVLRNGLGNRRADAPHEVVCHDVLHEARYLAPLLLCEVKRLAVARPEHLAVPVGVSRDAIGRGAVVLVLAVIVAGLRQSAKDGLLHQELVHKQRVLRVLKALLEAVALGCGVPKDGARGREGSESKLVVKVDDRGLRADEVERVRGLAPPKEHGLGGEDLDIGVLVRELEHLVEVVLGIEVVRVKEPKIVALGMLQAIVPGTAHALVFLREVQHVCGVLGGEGPAHFFAVVGATIVNEDYLRVIEADGLVDQALEGLLHIRCGIVHGDDDREEESPSRLLSLCACLGNQLGSRVLCPAISIGLLQRVEDPGLETGPRRLFLWHGVGHPHESV